VSTKPHTDDYLQVMPRYDAGPGERRWNVFRVSDRSPRITLAGTVTSCEDARRLAAHDKLPVRIAPPAWQQMLTAGVAPTTAPSGITIA